MLSAAVVPKTDCSSAHVLCLCGGLGSSILLCLLSNSGLSLSNLPHGFCLNYGFSAFRFCGFLRCNRPGFFIGLVLLNCLLHLLLFLCCCSSSEFLTVCTLSFNSAALWSFVALLAIFCIGVTSHRRDSLDSVSALTWFSHSSCSSPSTPRPHGRVLELVSVLSIPSVPLSVRVSYFVLCCSLRFLACGRVSLDLLHLAHVVSIIALLLVLLGYSLASTTF